MSLPKTPTACYESAENHRKFRSVHLPAVQCNSLDPPPGRVVEVPEGLGQRRRRRRRRQRSAGLCTRSGCRHVLVLRACPASAMSLLRLLSVLCFSLLLCICSWQCSFLLFLLAVCCVLCATFLELSNPLNNCIHAASLPTSHVSRFTESSAGRTRANRARSSPPSRGQCARPKPYLKAVTGGGRSRNGSENSVEGQGMAVKIQWKLKDRQ